MLKSVLLSLTISSTAAMATPYTAIINCGTSNPYFTDRCFSESDFVLKREGRTDRYNIENSLLTVGYKNGTGIAIELPEHFTIDATNSNNELLTIEIIRNSDDSTVIKKSAARNKKIEINQ